MKKLILLSAVFLFSLSCQHKDNNSAEAKSAVNGDSVLVLKVQVLDNLDSIKNKVGAWDQAMTYYVFRFKVLEVMDGGYDKPEIKINLICPFETIDKKRLENGKTYTYELRPATYINSDLKTVRAGYYEKTQGC